MPTPQSAQVTLPDVSTGQTQFLQQGAAIPAVASLLQNAANMDNQGFQSGVTAVDPSLTGNIGSVDALARQYALGGVDQDTRQAINRQQAYNAISGGYRAPDATAATGANPAASMMGAANAVAVGQQALQEQQQAPALENEAMSASLGLNPTHVDVGSTLISPAALQARQDQAAYYDNNLRNQAELINAGSQNQSNSQGISGAASGIGSLLKQGGGISGLFSGFG